MRALYASASGMAAQQLKLDTIANNMANLNTTGFKTRDVQFQDMLYAQMQQRPETSNIEGRITAPGLHLGHGVLAVGSSSLFNQGSLQATGVTLDFAIEGEGYFAVQVATADTGEALLAYSRDGSFKVAMDENEDAILVNAQGQPIYDLENASQIVLTDVDLDTLQVDNLGRISAKNTAGEPVDVGRIGMVMVSDPNANLAPAGENLFRFRPDADPNQIVWEVADVEDALRPRMKQGFLEQSNVDMTKQMTDMIVAQRAYSMNVKALQTVDQMMGLANNLRG